MQPTFSGTSVQNAESKRVPFEERLHVGSSEHAKFSLLSPRLGPGYWLDQAWPRGFCHSLWQIALFAKLDVANLSTQHIVGSENVENSSRESELKFGTQNENSLEPYP